MTTTQAVLGATREEVAESQGRKLGFLIAKSKLLSDAEKKAVVDLLPSMTAEQLDLLTNTLEAQHIAEETKQDDVEVVEALKDAGAEYNNALDTANKDILSTLANFQKKISN
jgi:hypothetical protein